MRALRVGPDSLRWSWSAPCFGAPVVAGGRAYVADRDSGDLLVLSMADGRVLQRTHAGALPHFPSQAVAGDWVFVTRLAGSPRSAAADAPLLR